MSVEQLLAMIAGAVTTNEVGGVPLVTAPQSFRTESLEKYLENPHRQRGTTTLHTAESFLEFVNRYAAVDVSNVYVDRAERRFEGVLNHGTHDEPAWGDFRAVFQPRLSNAWNAWEGIVGKPLSQTGLMEFLEDHLADVRDPSGAEMLALLEDFRVSTSGSFRSAKNLANGSVQFEYASDTRGNGTIEIPKEIKIELAVFEGQDPIEILVRFRYRMNEGVLTFRLEIARVDELVEAQFDDIVEQVGADLNGIALLYGVAAKPLA